MADARGGDTLHGQCNHGAQCSINNISAVVMTTGSSVVGKLLDLKDAVWNM